MNEKRDVIGEVLAEDNARPIHPAVAEYAVSVLHTAPSDGVRVAELELLNVGLWRQKEGLLSEIRSIQEDPEMYLRRLAHAKSTLEPEQPSGVVLPQHRDSDLRSPAHEHSRGWNDCLAEVARLNSSPVSAGECSVVGCSVTNRVEIGVSTGPATAGGVDERAAFEAFDYSDRCFRLRREGERYVYATTERELVAFRAGAAWQARAALNAGSAVPDHSEQGAVAYVDDHYLDQLRMGRGFSIGVTPAKHRRDGENNGLYTHPCADNERLLGELTKAKELLQESISTLYCENSEGGDVLDRVNAFLSAAAPTAKKEG